jgi:hypothetical protein
MTIRAKGSHRKQFGQLTMLLAMASIIARNGEYNCSQRRAERALWNSSKGLLATASYLLATASYLLATVSYLLAMASGSGLLAVASNVARNGERWVPSSQLRVLLLAVASDECQYGQKPKNHNFSSILMVLSSK